ncbi:MAG: hypothetical protein QHJ73_05380 [Armatimonadota bacterium]|nr:hypothetical protein [Armatimonadota bacterium]
MLRRKGPGVTLIECSMVSGVLAVLAAVVVPTTARVRDGLHTRSCQRNLQQIGVAWRAYQEDYDGMTVPVAGGQYVLGRELPAVRPEATWQGCLYPYVSHAGVFVCPAKDPRVPDRLPATASYGLNAQVSARALRDISQPAETVAVADCDRFSVLIAPSTADEALQRHLPAGRHLGGSNLLFADGHVKWGGSALGE